MSACMRKDLRPKKSLKAAPEQMLIYCPKYTLHCILLTSPSRFFNFKIFSRTQLSDFHHNATLDCKPHSICQTVHPLDLRLLPWNEYWFLVLREGKFPDDVSGAAVSPIFSGRALTDHWRRSPHRLPKCRREMYLAHCAKSPKPKISTSPVILPFQFHSDALYLASSLPLAQEWDGTSS